MVVKEEVRNRKIGQQLLEQAEGWAGRQGVRKLAVNTGKRRVESHLFYKNRGFEETGQGFTNRWKNRRSSNGSQRTGSSGR
ncbi:GNAT family N-acetyltransferase [Fictibacillus sp. B-59209]|uniref:GNAT family N-acetyltransferase n=1 Tax=Fictibacillus sp. B-59209 TaxID=3024873 RepID=UPI002E1BAC01|nr:GNAT family N-acetyltransferase [Fictibacillus sp. B-59209]